MPVNFNGSRQRQKRYERDENEPPNGANLAKIKYAFHPRFLGWRVESILSNTYLPLD